MFCLSATNLKELLVGFVLFQWIGFVLLSGVFFILDSLVSPAGLYCQGHLNEELGSVKVSILD